MSFQSDPVYLLSPLITSGAVVVLMFLVWKKSRWDFSSKLFFGVLLSLGLWALFTFAMRFSSDIDHALLWEKVLIASAIPLFAIYYHFTLAYTNYRIKRWVMPVVYSVMLVSVILVATTDWAIKGMTIVYYGYTPIVGPLFTVAYAPLPFFIIGGAINLFRRYRVSTSNQERNRLIYLIIAGVCPLVGVALDAFSPLPPAALWGNLLFSLICTAAILRYHLLDIRIVIRKSISYLFLSGTVAIPYVGILLLVNQILHTRIDTWWIHVIIILLLSIILRPVYSWAQLLVDRVFYRERYDFLRALEDFSLETHNITDLRQLSSSLVDLTSRALQSSGVYLLLPSTSGDFTTPLSSGGNVSQFSLEQNSTLLRWARFNKSLFYYRDLPVIPQLQSVTTSERNELVKIQAELFVPITAKEGELVGMLILGKKLSENLYSEEDERMVVTIADRMAVDLENARLYDTERAMRRELEKVDEQKTEFLHSVAHELKTPLTAIIASSELLDEEQNIAMDMQKRLISNINRSSLSMNRRVSELIDLATMQIEGLKIDVKPVEIGELMTKVTQQLQIIFNNKDQRLRLEMPLLLPKVAADKEKLEQVLFNLLSNASKFSPVGSEVTLRVRRAGNDLIIEVEDLAPAVTEAEKTKIFEPYYRGEDAKKRGQAPGLGLGLAISKTIVELHKGEIWVESKPTKGNIFAFSLPALYSQTNGVE